MSCASRTSTPIFRGFLCANNPVRLDAFVDALDLAAAGFVRVIRMTLTAAPITSAGRFSTFRASQEYARDVRSQMGQSNKRSEAALASPPRCCRSSPATAATHVMEPYAKPVRFQIVAKVRGKPTRVMPSVTQYRTWRPPVAVQRYNDYFGPRTGESCDVGPICTPDYFRQRIVPKAHNKLHLSETRWRWTLNVL